jgi:hypothetical protein
LIKEKDEDNGSQLGEKVFTRIQDRKIIKKERAEYLDDRESRNAFNISNLTEAGLQGCSQTVEPHIR